VLTMIRILRWKAKEHVHALRCSDESVSNMTVVLAPWQRSDCSVSQLCPITSLFPLEGYGSGNHLSDGIGRPLVQAG
jgi:hypothetical protein